jgi:hypothetical protein
MRKWRYGIVCMAIGLLLGGVFTAAATETTDPTGDVWHWSNTKTGWTWSGDVTDKPNVDITRISETVSGDNLTLSLTVAGTIQESEKVTYWAYYNTTDTTYSMVWSNGTGYAFAMKPGQISLANVTASGNTVSGVFSILGNTTSQELWGWAAEYTDLGNNQSASEWWGDWVPNSKVPTSVVPEQPADKNQSSNSSSSKTSTPGFEVLPLIAAFAIAVVLLRRRR